MKYALLEPLRGLAALWVFLFHYHFSEQLRHNCPTLHSLFKLGDLGIPMFFVLSGFCITASARSAVRHEEPSRNFLYRRARRIYPPYWFSIIVVIAIPFLMELISALKTGHYVPPSSEHINYGFLNYAPADWFLVCTLTQVLVHVPDAANLQGKFTTINGVYWTLAIEVQFYLVVTLALACRRYFFPVLLLVTAISAPFLLVPSSNLSGLFLPFWPSFAIGILLYWCCERGFSPSRLLGSKASILAPVICLSLVLGFLLYAVCGWPVTYLGFAVFFGLFLFFAKGLDEFFIKRGLSSERTSVRVIVGVAMALGAISYSLYLLHGRLQFLSMQVIRQFLPTSSIPFDCAVIAVTCVLCYLFYLVCEKPFMGARQPGLRSRPGRVSLPQLLPESSCPQPYQGTLR